MNKLQAETLRQKSQSDAPHELFDVVRAVRAHFEIQAELDPILHIARIEALQALRTLGYSRPDISAETGMTVDRIDELLTQRRRRNDLDPELDATPYAKLAE